jgi:membrane protease YdiL (CAAX protease family)
MAVPWLAGPLTLVLAGGTAVAVRRTAPVAWAWAAMVPAGALATVRWVSGVRPFDEGGACVALGAPRLTWSIVEAAVVLAAFTALALGLRTRRTSVGMRRPARPAVSLAVAGFGVLAVGGLVVASVVNGGVPGPSEAEPSVPAFVAAALVGGFAVATAEELAFRGVMQHWLARTTGEWPAVLVQAVAYGLWVAGVGWGPAWGVAAVAAGLVAGILTARTNSILVAWLWHAGIAVALMAAMLCA